MSSPDTTPDADGIRFARYARMSAAERLGRVTALTQASCLVALAGLRTRHPAADQRELLLRLAVLRLGPDLVQRAYGWSAPVSRADGA